VTSETGLKKIQNFIGRMPSLSTTVAKVLEICNTPSASANDLNRVIAYDPVLTGQMLKLINSAYYGLPNRVTSLTRAIIMLGINTVKNLVLTTSVLAGCKGLTGIRQMSIDDFWAHSLCTGVLAKLIAKNAGVPALEQEEYFVTGMLHDLGKLPIMACFAKRYEDAVENAVIQNIALVESETLTMGFNHCHVGVLIATKWKLGQGMQDGIKGHHARHCAPAPTFLMSSISAANFLANGFKIGTAGDQFLDPMDLQTHAESLGIGVQTLFGLKAEMEKEIDKAMVFLQIAGKGAHR
jgi:HD-like signal output (HDOD) protein